MYLKYENKEDGIKINAILSNAEMLNDVKGETLELNLNSDYSDKNLMIYHKPKIEYLTKEIKKDKE